MARWPKVAAGNKAGHSSTRLSVDVRIELWLVERLIPRVTPKNGCGYDRPVDAVESRRSCETAGISTVILRRWQRCVPVPQFTSEIKRP